MKKIVVSILFLTLFFLVSCTGTTETTSGTQSTTPTGNSTTLSTTTLSTTTTEFVNPFEGMDFIRHLELDPVVIQMIGQSSGRIAYIDEEMYVYYEEGISPTSVFVYMDGETREYDKGQTNGFVTNYDLANDVLYYWDDPSMKTVPSFIEDAIDLYPGPVSRIDHVTSQWVLANGKFRSFRGELLFSGGGTTVFPYTNLGEDLHFYTYSTPQGESEGCVIRSNTSFGDDPTVTVVHEEYVCHSDYRLVNRTVVIPLLHGSTTAGYVTITPDGVIHVMDFSIRIPSFQNYVSGSFDILNDQLLCFRYYDTAHVEHQVVTTYDLSVISFDQAALFSRYNLYVDDTIRFFEYSYTQYRLYKNENLLYTYAAGGSTSLVAFFRSGNYGVIVETNFNDGSGKITRVDLSDGSVSTHGLEGFLWNSLLGDTLMISENGECKLYYISDNQIVDLGITGTFLPVNDEWLLVYDDDTLTLIQPLEEGIIQCVPINIVGFLRHYLPYAFLVERDGEYYLIG